MLLQMALFCSFFMAEWYSIVCMHHIYFILSSVNGCLGCFYVFLIHLLLFSHVGLFATPWTAARQASLSFTISRSLLKLMSIKLVMPSSHLILCCPLLLLPSIFPSIRVFSIESALHIRWPKYRTFSLSISPSKEYSGLISFRTDLLAVQRTLKSLIQHHSLKASVLWCSAFFVIQLSHSYMTTGKNIALTVGSLSARSQEAGLTCLLRNLYTGQEATIITGCGTTNWFKFEKEVCQGYILSPCLFKFYAEYIMQPRN